MALENLQYKFENLSMYFQGGVRRSIIIFAVILLIAIFPAYYLGKFGSGLSARSYLNLNGFAINPKIEIYDYEIGKTQRAELKDGTSVLYAAIRNKKNRDVGFSPWNYSVQILDKDGAVITPKEVFSSYLLPDDNKFIVVQSPINGVDMQIIQEPGTQKINYNPNANPLLTVPNITVQNNRVELDTQNQTMTVSALLRNEDKRTVETIEVTYFVRDTQESILYVGTSSFNGFAPGAQRDFRINNLPLPVTGSPRSVDVRWSVNYLRAGTIKL